MLSLLELSMFAIIGAKVTHWMQTHHAVRSKSILLVCIAMMGTVPVWGLFALRTHAEFFAASALFGLAVGGYDTFNRCLFASCIPKGREAEFFGFFEVTNKGTAWMGPLLIAIVATNMGSY